MIKIAVITSTRAEFGLLMPVIKALRFYENHNIVVELVVTGTHLSNAHGNTIKEIEMMDIRIDQRVEVSVKSNNAIDISMNQAETLVKFTELFLQQKYNAIILLGDRYELLSIAIAAGNTQTPIFHLCGGDTTEGAVDEWIRHSISKMSYLHFVTNEESYRRVLQLGEDKDRVFNYGSTSIDNILSISPIKKVEALKELGLNDCKYAICTFHPTTLDNYDVSVQMNNLFEAIKSFPQIEFIFTKSNADQGGNIINNMLDVANLKIDNLHVYSSLGVVRYLSLMRYAEFVIGNSSSGIVETPAFSIPTINIGDRQKGRLQSESIINCNYEIQSIVTAINRALSSKFKEICKAVKSPYGDGHAAERIADKIIDVVNRGDINLKKRFCDL